MLKKYLPILVLPLLFSACSTGGTQHAEPDSVEVAPVRTGLLVEKSNPTDLKELDSLLLTKANFPTLRADEILKYISTVYVVNSKGEGMKNLPLKMDAAAIAKSQDGKLLSIEGENISFKQLYEETCKRAGLVWWVDGAVHVEVAK